MMNFVDGKKKMNSERTSCYDNCPRAFTVNARHAGAHLFFLQDDFLLQHFDGVEFAVGFELGEQDLHGGWFVSG